MTPSNYMKQTVHPGIGTFRDRLQAEIELAVLRPALYGTPVESNQANAQWVYGERLSALFGTCVSVEGCTSETVFFSVFPGYSFACNVSNVTVVGVRDERFQMSMTLIELNNQEAIEELYNEAGI